MDTSLIITLKTSFVTLRVASSVLNQRVRLACHTLTFILDPVQILGVIVLAGNPKIEIGEIVGKHIVVVLLPCTTLFHFVVARMLEVVKCTHPMFPSVLPSFL